MTYEQVASISQVVALLFFVALFAAVLVYAFWPGNKKRFEEAAKLPLEQDEGPEPKNEKNGKDG
jgi:cytochrome c oxidase cbb3-type subunit 4